MYSHGAPCSRRQNDLLGTATRLRDSLLRKERHSARAEARWNDYQGDRGHLLSLVMKSVPLVKARYPRLAYLAGRHDMILSLSRTRQPLLQLRKQANCKVIVMVLILRRLCSI